MGPLQVQHPSALSLLDLQRRARSARVPVVQARVAYTGRTVDAWAEVLGAKGRVASRCAHHLGSVSGLKQSGGIQLRELAWAPVGDRCCRCRHPTWWLGNFIAKSTIRLDG
jgi:hypothetical protein